MAYVCGGCGKTWDTLVKLARHNSFCQERIESQCLEESTRNPIASNEKSLNDDQYSVSSSSLGDGTSIDCVNSNLDQMSNSSPVIVDLKINQIFSENNNSKNRVWPEDGILDCNFSLHSDSTFAGHPDFDPQNFSTSMNFEGHSCEDTSLSQIIHTRKCISDNQLQPVSSSDIPPQHAHEIVVNGLPEDYASLELIRVLDQARCPRYLFDDILKWSSYARSIGCDASNSSFLHRNSFVSDMLKQATKSGITTPSFKMINVSMEAIRESDHVCVDVPVWDFEQQLDSLLHDYSLFGSKDILVLNTEDPFSPITDDVNICGEWYQATSNNLNISSEEGLLMIPLIFAVDSR